MKQGLTDRKPISIIARETGHSAGHTAQVTPASGGGHGDTVQGTHGRGRTRARSPRPDRGALDRLDPGYRTSRHHLAADHAVVPRGLPVLHHPDRVRRSRARPVPGLVDPGRRARHRVRHPVHGVPRHPGPGVRAAPDDPDPGPARLPRRRGRAVRRAVHLHGLQRGRPGAAGQRPERRVRLEPDAGRHRHRDPGRRAGHLRLRLGAPGLPVPADHLVPVLRDHLGRHPGRPRRRSGAPPQPLPLHRLHGPVLGRRRLQHHLRAVRLGLLPLHAAQHEARAASSPRSSSAPPARPSG